MSGNHCNYCSSVVYVIKNSKITFCEIYSILNLALKRMYKLNNVSSGRVVSDYYVEEYTNFNGKYEHVEIHTVPNIKYVTDNFNDNFMTDELWDKFIDEFQSTELLNKFNEHSKKLNEYLKKKDHFEDEFCIKNNIKQKHLHCAMYYTDCDIYNLSDYHQNSDSDIFIDYNREKEIREKSKIIKKRIIDNWEKENGNVPVFEIINKTHTQ